MSDNETLIRVLDGYSVHEITVRPDTTVADVLSSIGQESNGYWLTLKDGIPLEVNVAVYETVLDGDALIAVPECDGVA